MASTDPLLRPEQFERYRRHLYLPEFGVAGQRRLLEGSVVLVGAGGLGCPLALYLAAAGVGRIGLVDFYVVDPSNLQRQVLYGTADVGRPKIEVARERRPPRDMAGLLANDPTLETSPPAPPEGLFLARVEYPVHVLTPVAPEASDSRRNGPA